MHLTASVKEQSHVFPQFPAVDCKVMLTAVVEKIAGKVGSRLDSGLLCTVYFASLWCSVWCGRFLTSAGDSCHMTSLVTSGYSRQMVSTYRCGAGYCLC